MLELVFNRNCVYQIAYHVVCCPKYRRSVLTGTVAESLSALLSEVCEENNWKILNLEIQPDHIHLFVSIPPSKSVSEAVKRLKGTTARKLFLKHPELKKTTLGWASLVSLLLRRHGWQCQCRNDKAIH